jgi:glycosyltransferase involved in cell wall biosynthesis
VVTRPSPRWAAEATAAGFTHRAGFRAALDPLGAARLAATVRRERIAVIHAHKGGGRTLALLARLFGPRRPLVVNRGVSFPLSLDGRWLDGSRLVASVVAVCESIKADLVRQGIPAARVQVVYSGTDTDRFDPARVDGSRVRAEKRGPLEGLAAELALGAAVTLWGYRDDVPEILAASAVSVDGSHTGHGITGALRESLAMEIPVVATDAAGNPELVQHERTGLLVPPRDPAALAAAVLRLLGDPAWAKGLGRAGRARVVAGFSTRAKVERLEALYRRLAAGDGGRG